ncbi:hypothetical protein AB395_00006838 (plasmid) [Sinorhizobium fredii CCBAU 45436]|nr:hypothetical protein AB395_00006838 [Sinorhizobium fredii CCBAU 45436]
MDGIDSNKHNEYDNLQVVCRFTNRWKSAYERTRNSHAPQRPAEN